MPFSLQADAYQPHKVYAFVNLVSLYHDRILYDAARESGADFTPSLLNQYHRHWNGSSKFMLWLSSTLTLTQLCERFIEMCANKTLVPRKKWNMVIAIEAAKYVCPDAKLRALIYRLLEQFCAYCQLQRQNKSVYIQQLQSATLILVN